MLKTTLDGTYPGRSGARRRPPDACISAVIALIIAVGLATPGFAEEKTVRGRVVDASGKPVHGATVGLGWRPLFLGLSPATPATTDRDGLFTTELLLFTQPNALMAMDGRRARGGVVIVTPETIDELHTIRLEPLVTIRGEVDVSALPEAQEISLNIRAPECPIPLLADSSKQGRLLFALPPGKYVLVLSGGLADKLETELVVPDCQREIDLGTFKLAPNVRASLLGKEPPPWNVTDARGLAKGVKLSDFRGKWLVVDFWGYGCGPCVQYSLPYLTKFYERHRERRDRFEIVAFHDASVKNFAELDPKLKKIVSKVWNGKELPFPILLDGTGRTVKEWGVTGYPTAFLIDPQGKLVKVKSGSGPGNHAIEELLAEKLGRRVTADE